MPPALPARPNLPYRPFAEPDRAEFEQMAYSLYGEDPTGHPLTPEKIRQTIAVLTGQPGRGQIVIFEQASIIVGYAILIYYWSNEYGGNLVHIDELYVKPAWRRQGLATHFFAWLVETQPAQAVGLALEVTPTNIQAFQYYQRLGFTPSVNLHLERVASAAG